MTDDPVLSDGRPNQRPNQRPNNAGDRTRQNANLLKGVSSDPKIRAQQISKLQRHVTHGATAGAKLEAVRGRHEAELADDYPGLDRRRRALLADRLARVELASAWVSEHGITPDTKARRGEVWGIVDRLETWAIRAENLLREAEAERQTGRANVTTLESISAELESGTA